VKSDATLWWDAASESIRYIDQTLLPEEYVIVECRDTERLATAIRRLEIRGAPALGVAGACGVALAACLSRERDSHAFMSEVKDKAGYLRATRPTAINLAWGIDRVLQAMGKERDVPAMAAAAVAEAEAIAREDTACCHAIGRHGAALLPETCTVLTHCNAGALACSSWGTALGVIRSAVETGKQGARLTAWELSRDGIDVTVVTDSTAAHIMRTGAIDAVIVGADRITRDAVFNKIGTYMHAICARHHGIPFYVAAPLSTFDAVMEEHDVVIEERGREEVTTLGNRTFVPDTADVKNYAFDATPLNLVTAIVTERGVIRPPLDIPSLLSSPELK
jgi:methylthioribose-1-phosphate isomerase